MNFCAGFSVSPIGIKRFFAAKNKNKMVQRVANELNELNKLNALNALNELNKLNKLNAFNAFWERLR